MNMQPKKCFVTKVRRNGNNLNALVSVFLVGVFARLLAFTFPYYALASISSDSLPEGKPLRQGACATVHGSSRLSTSAENSRRQEAERVKEGMSYVYYITSCPRAYDIIRERIQFYISQDPSQAAGLIHLFFHDCFVQGCDGSIFLEMWAVSEQNAASNLNSLRSSSFHIIDNIKASLEVACPGVVSCADILALATRDAIFMVGGPWMPMLSGRKDSLTAASKETIIANIPSPAMGFMELKHIFASKGLNVEDLVALSGGHTIGQTHCSLAASQLVPIMSSDISVSYGVNLSRICLTQENSTSSRSHLTIHLDGLTPNTFDNAFFKNVIMKQVIFHSDAALLDDDGAALYVHLFANNEAEFFQRFRLSFVKMSEIGVLTGNEGEVRLSCTMANT